MEVILCKICEGHGSHRVWDDGDRIKQTCKKCNGSGRLLIKQYTIELPFDTKPDHYIEADNDIIRIIKQLNKNR